MPAAGTGLKYGERYNPLNKKLWKAFVKETGVEITYELFREIIWETNQLIADTVANEESGVELPEGLGFLVVTKYKCKKAPIDWYNSNRLGKRVPHLNLHTYGYVHEVKWFKVGVKFRNSFIYKYKTDRDLARSIPVSIKAGKKFFAWDRSDFYSTTRLERSFNKFYKKPDQ